MLPQPSLHHHQHHLHMLSPLSNYPRIPSCQNPNFTPHNTIFTNTNTNIFKCSASTRNVKSYRTVDYERRPMINWNTMCRKISTMEDPESGAGSVLDYFEQKGKKITKWEISRIVKELRKYRRYKRALEVYNWMNNREELYRVSASDAAIQLDLIAKVHGVSAAESFFLGIPDSLKDRRVYGALLNAYAQQRMREKAESVIEDMRNKGFATHALPFNVMMTLYMNLKEFEKVELIVSEMMEKSIKLDLYSYNIWLSCCGSQRSIEGMEQVFEKMQLDTEVEANWSTFSTMATMYVKMGENAKAEDFLKKAESKITGRDRIPYHYLLSLYGNVGKKEEVYRVWNIYKSVFPRIPNLGYHAMISSLVRLGDIEGAEMMYAEWLPIKTSYDSRIGNLIMGCYVTDGNFEKAKSFFDHMVEAGGKPNSSTWEMLAEGHIVRKSIPEALSCLREAFADEGSKSWKPKPTNVASFFRLCEEESDLASEEVLLNLLRQSGCLENNAYTFLLGLSNEVLSDEHETGSPNDIEDNEGSKC